MMSRQPLATRDGLTHADSVMAVVSRSTGASVIVTIPLPVNTRALPNLPAGVQVALLIAPGLPLPDPSATVGPAPSSNPYPATSPEFPAGVVVVATLE